MAAVGGRSDRTRAHFTHLSHRALQVNRRVGRLCLFGASIAEVASAVVMTRGVGAHRAYRDSVNESEGPFTMNMHVASASRPSIPMSPCD